MTAVDGDLRAPLLRLPQELLVSGVASFLTTAELGTFRLTCKNIERQLYDSFAHEFFHKKSFLIEEPSLQTLLHISRHPGFRIRLTDLIFDARAILPVSINGRASAETVFMEGNQFRQSGLARDMLVEALQGLPNIRTISYRDFDSVGRVREGEHGLWQPWGYSLSQRSVVVPDENGHKLSLILLACALSGTRPTKLEVLLRRRAKLDPYSMPSPYSYAVPQRFFDLNQDKVLQGLKVMMLAVTFRTENNYYHHDVRNYNDGNRYEGPLRNLLQLTPELEVLRLNFTPTDEYTTPFLSWLGRRPSSGPGPAPPILRLNSLTTLDLGKATIWASSMISALTKFDLKSISLWEITLRQETDQPHQYEPDLWSVTLDRLSRALSPQSRLCYFMIGRPRQEASDLSVYRQPSDTSFVAEGGAEKGKKKAPKQDTVKFEANKTGKAVQQWLKELSGRTHVTEYRYSESRSEADSDEDDM